jgi:hypothetical protein
MNTIQSMSDTLLSITRSCARACVHYINNMFHQIAPSFVHTSTSLFSLPRTYVRSLIITMRPRAHHSFYCSNTRASGATELSIRMRLDNLADVESAHKGGDGRWRMQSWLLAVTSGTSVLCVNPHPLLRHGQRCSHQSHAQYTCCHCVWKLRNCRFRLVHSVKSAQKR